MFDLVPLSLEACMTRVGVVRQGDEVDHVRAAGQYLLSKYQQKRLWARLARLALSAAIIAALVVLAGRM